MRRHVSQWIVGLLLVTSPVLVLAATEGGISAPKTCAQECVQVADYFNEPASDLDKITVGPFTFEAAVFQKQTLFLSISDCSSDKMMEVWIPSSSEAAEVKASMTISRNLCNGEAPLSVELTVRQFNSCTVYAFDDTGLLVDSAVANATSEPQALLLWSNTGIRKVEFVGAEICVSSICWICLGVEPTPTPTETPQNTETPTPSPTPTTPVGPGPEVWVDASNQSGIEDGSELYPFRTISQALIATITPTYTINVRAGMYNESLTIDHNVRLLGAGADRTIINGSPLRKAEDLGTGILCVGLGPETEIAGFTITGASVGIDCYSSSPTIRENIITNIDYTSLGADGIRLTDSSPIISNNLIYHVGGMGIRGQGESDPSIINNTIYDYGYYAGISFAALNIGAVTPVIKNNIIVRGNEEPVGGILWRQPAAPVISYNDVYGVADVTGTGSYYSEHNGVNWVEMPGGTGAISQDPLFVDPLNGIFYLNLSSPCIDAGDPAPEYNDIDGSRNDMGAYGGQRTGPGPWYHPGSGFIFTSVGKIPITEIVQADADPLCGLANVSPEAAAAYHIPQYVDTAFAGSLWIRGLFGVLDNVDYYQLTVTPLDGVSPAFMINDPLTKTLYTITDGSVTATQINLGPLSIGSVDNLYRLNKTGYWSDQDLRATWNTTGLNGKYRLNCRGYRLTELGTVEEVTLASNDLDHLILWIDGSTPDVRINSVTYANGDPILECEDILFPHAESQQLIFNITATHPGGFLNYYLLDCYWGHSHYGGRFTYDQYQGVNDGSAPTWTGVISLDLPPLQPTDSFGSPIPWQNCAYRFYMELGSRITDGFTYLAYDTYSEYHGVEVLTSKPDANPSSPPCKDCTTVTQPETPASQLLNLV